MTKHDLYDELDDLLKGKDKRFFILLLTNWFSTQELKEFTEFVNDEC